MKAFLTGSFFFLIMFYGIYKIYQIPEELEGSNFNKNEDL